MFRITYDGLIKPQVVHQDWKGSNHEMNTIPQYSVRMYQREETRTFKNMNPDVILQHIHKNMLAGSNDTDMHADNDEGDTRNTNRVMSLRVEVCVSRKMILSRNNLDHPSKGLSNPDKRTDDTPTRKDHSTINIIDPRGEVCIDRRYWVRVPMIWKIMRSRLNHLNTSRKTVSATHPIRSPYHRFKVDLSSSPQLRVDAW